MKATGWPHILQSTEYKRLVSTKTEIISLISQKWITKFNTHSWLTIEVTIKTGLTKLVIGINYLTLLKRIYRTSKQAVQLLVQIMLANTILSTKQTERMCLLERKNKTAMFTW
jgi:hypothetical protein